MTIAKDCMIVNLSISMWTGYRLDKEASKNVTDNAHAEADVARVNKLLVPKSVTKPVTNAKGKIRSHFYKNTLPWKDNGDRLLTRKLFTKFIEEHEELVSEFNAAVDHLISVEYAPVREKAEFRMGDLFNPADYPSPNTLRNKFGVSFNIDAVTEAGDFRVDLDEATVDTVRKNMEADMQKRLNGAIGDIWERLSTTLGHFAEKMGPDEVFRDSLVRNLEEIVDLLPALNLTDDPGLEAIRQQIAAKLIGHKPEDLRTKPEVRSAAAIEAQQIMNNMRGFMKAFGGQD